ncbi:MAG: helix-turn-helix domain-containing protein [Chloroflexi bacterium]|nr:helix-turn-helix domain-containing protein [Chloroflexota bacterium]
MSPGRETPRRRWQGVGVKALREHLGYSQQRLAQELGTRQQTISEWETGLYAPGGISSTLLNVLAERADFHYEARAGDRDEAGGKQAGR